MVNKLSWKIMSDEFYEFEDFLRKNNIEFYEENEGFIITHKGDVDLYSLTSLHDNIQFNNNGYVYLSNLTSLPDNVQFNNKGVVYLPNLTSLPDNVQFNNKGDVDLYRFESLPMNKYEIFKNDGIVYYNYEQNKFDPRIKEKLSFNILKEEKTNNTLDDKYSKQNALFIYVKPDEHIPLDIEEEHTTVVYLHNSVEGEDRKKVITDISKYIQNIEYPSCSWNGIATFDNDDKSRVILINFENGAELYTNITEILEKYIDIDKDYDFIPHMTIDKNLDINELPAYEWKPKSLFIEFEEGVPAIEIEFKTGKVKETQNLQETAVIDRVELTSKLSLSSPESYTSGSDVDQLLFKDLNFWHWEDKNLPFMKDEFPGEDSQEYKNKPKVFQELDENQGYAYNGVQAGKKISFSLPYAEDITEYDISPLNEMNLYPSKRKDNYDYKKRNTKGDEEMLFEKGLHQTVDNPNTSREITPYGSKLSWKIMSDEFYEFEEYLRKNNIEFYEENEGFIITHNGDVYLYSIKSLPNNIQFNNNGYVYLHNLTSLPNNVQFNNNGYVEISNLTFLSNNIQFNNKGGIYLYNLTFLSNNIQFNNKGDVDLYSLKSLPDNIQFNNEGYVDLTSLKSLPNNIRFNNNGYVNLRNLKSLPNNIQFNNNGDVNLYNLTSLPTNKYEIFKNDGIVYYNYGENTFDPKQKQKLSWKSDIQQVVNDPEWQGLRKSLVGTWKKSPEENIKKLRDYVGDMQDPLKLRRVHNYLTGSGFRIGVISHPDITKLLNEVREKRKEKKANQTYDVFDSQTDMPEDFNFTNEMTDDKLRRTNPNRYDKRKDWFNTMNDNLHDSDVSNRYDSTNLMKGSSEKFSWQFISNFSYFKTYYSNKDVLWDLLIDLLQGKIRYPYFSEDKVVQVAQEEEYLLDIAESFVEIITQSLQESNALKELYLKLKENTYKNHVISSRKLYHLIDIVYKELIEHFIDIEE